MRVHLSCIQKEWGRSGGGGFWLIFVFNGGGEVDFYRLTFTTFEFVGFFLNLD